jgi:hypothetical protein
VARAAPCYAPASAWGGQSCKPGSHVQHYANAKGEVVEAIIGRALAEA